jgi:hypothetical protein
MAGAAASAALRQRISDVLMSDSCQRIDFRWGPYHVDGWAYTAVALSAIGASRSLHIAVGHLPATAGAQYDPNANTLRVPSVNFASPGNASVGWERMTIVHECTHAAVDQMRRAPRVLYRSNEVLAYVGGTLFNLYEGRPYAPWAGSVSIVAERVANAIKDSPGAIIGPAADVQALETAITNSATYTFLRRRPHTMTRNSGLPF